MFSHDLQDLNMMLSDMYWGRRCTHQLVQLICQFCCCVHTGDLVRVELPHARWRNWSGILNQMFWLELSQYVWIFISSSLLHRWCLVDGAYCSYVQSHPCNDFQLQTTHTNAHNLLMTPTGNSSAKRIMVRALGFQSLVSHTTTASSILRNWDIERE